MLQNIENDEELQDSLTMLKIVAMSTKSMIEEKGQTIKKAFDDVRKRVKQANSKIKCSFTSGLQPDNTYALY